MWSRPLLAIALLGACSSDRTGGNRDRDADTDVPPDTATTPGETDTAPDAVPVWFGVDGELVLAGGALDALLSNLRLTFLTADEEVVCVGEAAPDAATALAAPESEPAIYAWWSLDLSDGVDCAGGVAAQVNLGIGAYDAQLDPAAAARELDTATLYGLYFQSTVTADAPVYVFGVTGTAANFAGTTAVVTAPPVPDGTYTLAGLYLLPLDTGP